MVAERSKDLPTVDSSVPFLKRDPYDEGTHLQFTSYKTSNLIYRRRNEKNVENLRQQRICTRVPHIYHQWGQDRGNRGRYVPKN